MLKKTLIGATVAMVAGTFLFGRDLFSYVKTSADSVRTAVRREVPFELEIERLRNEVENVMPDIRNVMRQIAEAEVDVNNLRSDVALKQAGLAQRQEEILVLRQDLDSGRELRYVGRVYTPAEVNKDLARRFNRFKVAKDTVERDRKILVAKTKTVEASRKKLENMLASKRDLEVKIENLEAKFRTFQAQQAIAVVAIDDSRLSRCKQAIADLNKQIDVKMLVLESEDQYGEGIPVQTGPKTPDDLVEQIDAYFGNGKKVDEPKTVASNNDA